MESIKVQTRGDVYSQGEKFVTVKLVKSCCADNIRCCSVMLCVSSIWAPSRRSVLPHRLHCHNKITGGLLDSSFPHPRLTVVFFLQSLEKNIYSFSIKSGEAGGRGRKLLLYMFRCKTIFPTVKVPLLKILPCLYEN